MPLYGACISALLVTFVAVQVALASEQLGKAECLELGFTGEQLCSDCDSLAGYVKDEGLVSECKQCCTRVEGGAVHYESATLEVCPYRLNGLPQIKDFIDKKAKQYYKALTIRTKYGAYPRLILHSGSMKNALRIDNWKASNIMDYLDDKLVPSV